MLIIAHRGLLNGPDHMRENTFLGFSGALREGFGIEIDFWKLGNKYFVGHDRPQEPIDIMDSLYRNNLEKIWWHAKNYEAFHACRCNEEMNVFWHTDEDFVLTTRGEVWANVGVKYPGPHVCVLPEKSDWSVPDDAHAVCTDYPYKFRASLT